MGRPIESVRVDPVGLEDPEVKRRRALVRRSRTARPVDPGPPSREVEAVLATKGAVHLLGDGLAKVPVLSAVDALAVQYEKLDPGVLERDLERVERFYRRRGHYDAKVTGARVRPRDDGKVDVEIVVDEGPVVAVQSVRVEAPGAPEKVAKELRAAALRRLPIGAAFDEDAFEEARESLLRLATRDGYAHVKVTHRAAVDPAKREAKLELDVELGPACVFGEPILEGSPELPHGLVRQILDIPVGKPFSTERLERAEQELASWGITGSIGVRPVLEAKDGKPDPVVRVRFLLGKTSLRSLRAGVGAEVGGRVETHAVGGYEDRNLFGGLRRLTAELRGGLVFFPVRLDTLFTSSVSDVLPEGRFKVELRQPMPFDVRTSAVLRGSAAAYRQQTSDAQINDGAGINVYGYVEGAGALGLERSFFGALVSAGLFYSAQYSAPFSYNSDSLPEGFGPITLSMLQASLTVDYRRDARDRPERIRPNRGVWFGLDAQLAGIFLGGDANDVRLRGELRGYVPFSNQVTLAARLTTGLLFPTEPGKLTIPEGGCAGLSGDAKTQCEVELGRALQRLQFRAFYSGGANSNRGYGYNGVGPRRLVPQIFLNDATTDLELPIGGATLWEASLELRFPISGPLGGVGFVEASNVGEGVLDFRFDAPHVVAGLGARLGTPIGPVRLDLGVRIPCLQVIGVCDEPEATFGTPPTLFGLPAALSFAIGESF